MSISWDTPFTWSQIFGEIPTFPRLGLLVPAVSLTYFAISKSPARCFGTGKLSSFDLWRSMKVDSSQFFDDLFSSWIFRRTKYFVASKKFLGAHIWCNPQMWCPGHFVGTWLVWHLCGVPMAMILHLSWWYGQFFQQGWLGMTSRLKFRWKSKWYGAPYDWIPMGTAMSTIPSNIWDRQVVKNPSERLGFSCWIRSNHIPPTQRFCRVTEGCCCECVKYADVVPKKQLISEQTNLEEVNDFLLRIFVHFLADFYVTSVLAPGVTRLRGLLFDFVLPGGSKDVWHFGTSVWGWTRHLSM